MESVKEVELKEIEIEKDEEEFKEQTEELKKDKEDVEKELKEAKKRSGPGKTENLVEVFFDNALRALFRRSLVTVDRFVFRLHYQITTPVLLIACALFSAKQFFGKPIKCFLPSKKIKFPVKVIESYCWAEGTFSIPEGLNKTVGLEVPYMGVDQRVPGDEVIHHAYYQWVCFVLFLQALCFALPHLLWMSWEDYNIFSMLRGLHRPLVTRRWKIYSRICSDLNNKTFAIHGLYRKYLLCQLLCLVNIVGQMYIMDAFLDGRFHKFGLDAVKYANGEQQVDPMKALFPRLTKCTFHHFGWSGDIQKLDSLCVLPLNILNEKLYVVLWFWCKILTALTALDLAYCLLAALSTKIRCLMILCVNLLVTRRELRPVVDTLDGEQWFLLYMLGANMDRLYFQELVQYMNTEPISQEEIAY